MNLFDEQGVSYLLLVLGVFNLMMYVMSFTFILISLFYGKLYLHKKVDPDVLGDDVPGVSIVKPLMGIDPLLETNLESHFTLKYPKFELLLCFHDDQDPAINIVNRLQQKYPKVEARLFFHGREDIINPMVQNMVQGYEAAQYEYVWISSSRILASTEILQDMVVKLQQPNVALVHQMPFYIHTSNFASIVEKVYFGCALARYYLAFNVLGMCCVTGMSYVFKKSILEQQKGLGWYGQYLAEDFFLTKAMHERGHKFVVSAFPAQQNVSSTSVESFVGRMVRWLRLRLNMLTVVASILEPLSDCFPLGITSGCLLYHFFSIDPVIFFCCHVCVWIVIDYIQLCNVQNGPLPFGKLKFLAAWFTRELLSTFVFLKAVVNPHRIKWGKHTYYVHMGGHTEVERHSHASQDL
ncbi:hypothetical protein C0Q70_20474 [Pomacea canaliculata]|uniref:ceramide glucosyltransferase n=2 Tax=Pomacea canaliculata TaxID=400727 RepID=A0A2T7NFN4_POMCA|nr:ceramide glucosyltransferase-like isoform X2 [Pomacea canaliculata]XP_025077647.1 ceramide glucosyltransferase-like isoform X2 [Pomacea canaliculata]PVD19980.1 hypothetical protein C0Q70_20474 [Pomacea canaliculata]